MACDCQDEKSLVILKNYPTLWDGVDWLSIKFDSIIDLTGFTAIFRIDDIVRQWDNLTEEKIINLTKEETGSLDVGMTYASLVVYDKENNGKPFTTSVPVLVKDWVSSENEIDTFNMSVNALLDGITQMTIRVETAKISVDWVKELIETHDSSETAHKFIQDKISVLDEKIENVDSDLSQKIDAVQKNVDKNQEEVLKDIDDLASIEEGHYLEINNRITREVGVINQTIETKVSELNAEDVRLQGEIDEQSQRVDTFDDRIKANANAIITESEKRLESDNKLANDLADETTDRIISYRNLQNTKQDKLIAGDGISIENNVITNTRRSAEWGNIVGSIENQQDLQEQFNTKQDSLISGVNIKTINDQSILGEGNIKIEGGTGGDIDGGSATSVYLISQIVDGGSAFEP